MLPSEIREVSELIARHRSDIEMMSDLLTRHDPTIRKMNDLVAQHQSTLGKMITDLVDHHEYRSHLEITKDLLTRHEPTIRKMKDLVAQHEPTIRMMHDLVAQHEPALTMLRKAVAQQATTLDSLRDALAQQDAIRVMRELFTQPDSLRVLREAVDDPESIDEFAEELSTGNDPQRLAQRFHVLMQHPLLRGLLLLLLSPLVSALLTPQYQNWLGISPSSPRPVEVVRKTRIIVEETKQPIELLKGCRIVSKSMVSVKGSPKAKSRHVGYVLAGRIVTLVEKRGKWSHIEWSDAAQNRCGGWVRSKYLKKLYREH